MKLTKEEAINKYSKSHGLNMGSLRKFVESNPDIDDNTPILIERVEDSYFEDREINGKLINGWDICCVEGHFYHNAIKHNKEYDKNKVLYDNKDYEDMDWDFQFFPKIRKYSEEELENLKEQFYYGWCISKEKDNSLIYIYSHY